MKIYHYLSSKYALENLIHRRIKISRLHDLNDPFELVAANHSDNEERVIWEEWKRTQSEKLGLVCFSKTWGNPVLWSHYADRHRGMCLGFNVTDKAVNQVVYTRNRINMNILKLSEEGKLSSAHMSKIFKTKYIDWKYEREARVFAYLEKPDEKTGLYFHEFDNDMILTDIFIGPLCPETENEIRASLQPKDSHVNIVKTRIAHKTFNVVAQDSKY